MQEAEMLNLEMQAVIHGMERLAKVANMTAYSCASLALSCRQARRAIWQHRAIQWTGLLRAFR
jgi:hypothetical protein